LCLFSSGSSAVLSVISVAQLPAQSSLLHTSSGHNQSLVTF
jgi:hypothetical protein